MHGVVCAVAVGISDRGATVLDPADGECVRAGCFAFFFSEAEAPEGEIVWADWKGTTTKEEVRRCTNSDRRDIDIWIKLVRTSGEAGSDRSETNPRLNT